MYGQAAHTLQPQTKRDLQSRFGREKITQRFKLQQIVKKNPKKYSSQNLLKETMKKCSTLASNTSSFNGRLCLIVKYFMSSHHRVKSCPFSRHKSGEGEGGGVGGYSLTLTLQIMLWNSVKIRRAGGCNPTVRQDKTRQCFIWSLIQS